MSTLDREVVYPPRCEGKCHLPEAVLKAVGGVLAANCPGPRLPLEGEPRIAFVSNGTNVTEVGIGFDQQDPVCQNPRVTKAARDILDRAMRNSFN